MKFSRLGSGRDGVNGMGWRKKGLEESGKRSGCYLRMGNLRVSTSVWRSWWLFASLSGIGDVECGMWNVLLVCQERCLDNV